MNTTKTTRRRIASGALLVFLATAVVLAVVAVLNGGGDNEYRRALEACSNDPNWDGTLALHYRTEGGFIGWVCGVDSES